MSDVTLRIGRGPKAPAQDPSPTLTAKLGLLVDRITSVVWGGLAVMVLIAPYLALKPATNFWWWP